jgi:hypothetical protein
MRGCEKNAGEEELQDNPLIRSTPFHNRTLEFYPEGELHKISRIAQD